MLVVLKESLLKVELQESWMRKAKVSGGSEDGRSRGRWQADDIN